MESARTRSELAKEMGMRYKLKEPIDWKNLLEYLAVRTIREYEKGEPVVHITSEDSSQPLEYLIYPIAPLNKPSVIFGLPGSGKSSLALILNLLIALPWGDNPLRLTAPKQPVVALYLDYEADEEDIRRHLVSLAQGMNLQHIVLNYRRCSLPLADDLEAIRNQIDDTKATCLIIDSMSLAAGGDLNRMDIATAYFRALRSLPSITSLSLAHTRKEGEGGSRTIIGSILWEAGARSVWEIRGEGEEDEDIFNIGLFHRKANLSRKAKPLGFRIAYEDNLPHLVEWLDPKSVPELMERMGTNQRILGLLKEGPQSDKEIEETLGITANNRRVAIFRLKQANAIVGIQGKWGLASRHFEG